MSLAVNDARDSFFDLGRTDRSDEGHVSAGLLVVATLLYATLGEMGAGRSRAQLILAAL